MDRKGQKEGGMIAGTHPLPTRKVSSLFLDDKTSPLNQGPSGNGLRRRPDSWVAGRAQGRVRMSHSLPGHTDDKQHVLEADPLWVIL